MVVERDSLCKKGYTTFANLKQALQSPVITGLPQSNRKQSQVKTGKFQ